MKPSDHTQAYSQQKPEGSDDQVPYVYVVWTLPMHLCPSENTLIKKRAKCNTKTKTYKILITLSGNFFCSILQISLIPAQYNMVEQQILKNKVDKSKRRQTLNRIWWRKLPDQTAGTQDCEDDHDVKPVSDPHSAEFLHTVKRQLYRGDDEHSNVEAELGELPKWEQRYSQQKPRSQAWKHWMTPAGIPNVQIDIKQASQNQPSINSVKDIYWFSRGSVDCRGWFGRVGYRRNKYMIGLLWALQWLYISKVRKVSLDRFGSSDENEL